MFFLPFRYCQVIIGKILMRTISNVVSARHTAKTHCVPTRCTRLSTQAPAQIRPIGLRRPPSLLECSSLRLAFFSFVIIRISLCLRFVVIYSNQCYHLIHIIANSIVPVQFVFAIAVIRILGIPDKILCKELFPAKI